MKKLAAEVLRIAGAPQPAYSPSAASESHQPLPYPVVEVLLACWDQREWRSSSDALTDWINARWKAGFTVTREVVCFTLRAHGRDARMGLGDHLHGAFCR